MAKEFTTIFKVVTSGDPKTRNERKVSRDKLWVDLVRYTETRGHKPKSCLVSSCYSSRKAIWIHVSLSNRDDAAKLKGQVKGFLVLLLFLCFFLLTLIIVLYIIMFHVRSTKGCRYLLLITILLFMMMMQLRTISSLLTQSKDVKAKWA